MAFTHTFTTISFRKAARVPYPNAYATANEAAASPEKWAFNAAQRAHAQFVEQYPGFLVALGVAGLRYPVAAAGLGASWIVARLLFLLGYTRAKNNENGRGRHLGGWYIAPQLALVGMALWTGVQMVL